MVGRELEINLLNQLESTEKPELVVVYGRRRVGKTYLIREYYKDKIVLDFVGSNKENTSTQISNFNKAFSEQCHTKYKDATNWSDAFNHLAKHLKTLPKTKKAVVFLDEFPWLDKPQSGFLGAFEYFWNQHASKMNHLIFVACGSVASWIINNLINNYGGLHNRVTLSLEIKPFTLGETEQFLKYNKLKFTRYQILQLYMATGGVPYYLERIPNATSVAQAINKLFFTSSASLGNEFSNLYSSLFKKPSAYITIVKTLASHHYDLTRTALISKSGLAIGGSFNRVMDTLEECGFIIKMIPFGKKNREATYRLIDFFSIFYMKFIDNLKQSKVKTWQGMENSIAYKVWCGYAFENLCLLHLPQLQASLGIQGMQTSISSWSVIKNEDTAGAQVDIVIERKDGIIHLCEAKFSTKSFITSEKIKKDWSNKRAIFEFRTKTKSAVVTTFIGTYPPMQNTHFKNEVHSSVLMDDLFLKL